MHKSNNIELGYLYGWAFGLPEIFGSGSSGFRNFGFLKMIPEISWEKEEPENSGTRKFGFGFGFYPNYLRFRAPPPRSRVSAPPARRRTCACARKPLPGGRVPRQTEGVVSRRRVHLDLRPRAASGLHRARASTRCPPPK